MLSCTIYCGQVEAGPVHSVLTRGQTGLTIAQPALLLRDMSVWTGSGKCGFHATAAEEVSRLPAQNEYKDCSFTHKRLPHTHACRHTNKTHLHR